MFSYNDGELHEEVKLLGDFEPVTLSRVGNTTQYVAPSTAIYELRDTAAAYRHKVDNKTLETRVFNRADFHAKKKEWEGTPYLHVQPKEPATTLIYLIPGNPGVCEYYYEFAEALARQIPGSEVAAVSYLGYNLDSGNKSENVIGLDEQVDHKVEFLDFLLSARALKPRHVIVLGHSVGSWIAQRVAVRNDSVTAVGLLTPTIRNIASSERGEAFTRATRYVGPRFFYYSSWLLSTVMSSYVLSLVVGKLMPKSQVGEEAREASVKLARTPAVVRQIIGMAIEEMQRIGDDIEPAPIRGFWDRCEIWACFAKDDHWVSKETRDSLLEHTRAKPNVRTVVASVPHAFCLRDSEAVAGLAAQQINSWIQ